MQNEPLILIHTSASQVTKTFYTVTQYLWLSMIWTQYNPFIIMFKNGKNNKIGFWMNHNVSTNNVIFSILINCLLRAAEHWQLDWCNKLAMAQNRSMIWALLRISLPAPSNSGRSWYSSLSRSVFSCGIANDTIQWAGKIPKAAFTASWVHNLWLGRQL